MLFGRTDEPQEGLAHFAEHIGNTVPIIHDYSYDGIEVLYGNAFTRPDYTSFWLTGSGKGFENLIRSRIDRLSGPLYRHQIFERERGRVRQELEYTRSSNQGYLATLALERAFFGGDPAIEREIANTERFTVADVRRVYEKRYLADASVIAVVGDIDLARARRAFEEAVAKVPVRTSDAAIAAAGERLIAFYERWLAEALLRVLADHLVGFLVNDGDAARLHRIREEIRAVSPDAVRQVMDRYLIDGERRTVMLVPTQVIGSE